MSVYNIKRLKASSDNFRSVKDGLWAQLTSNDVDTVKVRSIIKDGSILNVGNKLSIFFWHDKLCEIGPLKEVFPRLFSISTQKNLFINQMGCWQDDS